MKENKIPKIKEWLESRKKQFEFVNPDDYYYDPNVVEVERLSDHNWFCVGEKVLLKGLAVKITGFKPDHIHVQVESGSEVKQVEACELTHIASRVGTNRAVVKVDEWDDDLPF